MSSRQNGPHSQDTVFRSMFKWIFLMSNLWADNNNRICTRDQQADRVVDLKARKHELPEICQWIDLLPWPEFLFLFFPYKVLFSWLQALGHVILPVSIISLIFMCTNLTHLSRPRLHDTAMKLSPRPPNPRWEQCFFFSLNFHSIYLYLIHPFHYPELVLCDC